MIPGSASAQFFGAAGSAGGGGGYEIERSLRFNSSDSAFCSRVPSTAGNRQKWTWAAWVKRTAPGSYDCLFSAANGSSFPSLGLFITTADRFRIAGSDNGLSDAVEISTTALFRDPSAWYHVVVAWDTTQSTAANRLKLYINGSQVDLNVDNVLPSQNYSGAINNTWNHAIGAQQVNGLQRYHDGLLADIHFIDSQALDPTSFGEFDTNGVWQPIDASGLTYGTNGFYLPFSDNSTAAALGTDTSGNGNDWTPNNLSNVTGGPTSVAAASGALPIYNTTDTYGATKGTGTRTDSNSSSIVLAIPMDGANNGTTFTDEAPTIKGSGSAKTITPNGDVKTNTALSKYYGSSGYFDGTGDYLTAGTSSDYTFGTGDFAVECFVYFNASGTYQDIFSTANYNSNNLSVRRNNSNQLEYYINDGFPAIGAGATMPAGKWYHIAITRSSGTVRLFVDGVIVHTATQTFNFSTSGTFTIGRVPGNSLDLNGYLQDFRIYKGVAKYTGNFNPPSSTQNPTIAAGNDSLVDSPTNYGTDTGAGGEVRGNYATLNPLAKGTTQTLSSGNLDVTPSGHGTSNATIAVTAGSKVYMEFTRTGGTDGGGWGFTSNLAPYSSYPGSPSNLWWVYDNGGNFVYINNGTQTEYASKATNGQILQLAIDYDAGKAWIGINNTWFTTANATTGDPAAGANPTFTFTTSLPLFPLVESAGWTVSCNFGQRPFAYTAPSGFKALCTTNLPEPTIADGSTVMDVALYTGNGSTQTISGLNFSPDLVWAKSRSAATNHGLIDTVRGRGFILVSDLTVADQISPAGADLASFDANGFTLGAPNAIPINVSGQTYAAWTWDAGSSTVTNTQGSITSQVRANASAGFSVVTYTVPSGLSTGDFISMGHGLGVLPGLIVLKERNNVDDWLVIHKDYFSTQQYLLLNQTAAISGPGNAWGAGITSSVFGQRIGSLSGGGENCVAYCFAPVAGYSSFGSYTGNGSTDGPFVYTGMRPKFLLFKSAGAGDWVIIDATRDTYNVSGYNLYPNDSVGESFNARLDILSNGFKLRSTFTSTNPSGTSVVYAAFAENPFQYARAR